MLSSEQPQITLNKSNVSRTNGNQTYILNKTKICPHTKQKQKTKHNNNKYTCVTQIPPYRHTVFSLGGHQPYVPILMTDDEARKSGGANVAAPGVNAGPNNANNSNSQYGVSNSTNNESKQRARVLCSYDAKDSTELNLSANEVSLLQLASHASSVWPVRNSSMTIDNHYFFVPPQIDHFRDRIESSQQWLYVWQAGPSQRPGSARFPRNIGGIKCVAHIACVQHIVFPVWYFIIFATAFAYTRIHNTHDMVRGRGAPVNTHHWIGWGRQVTQQQH